MGHQKRSRKDLALWRNDFRRASVRLDPSSFGCGDRRRSAVTAEGVELAVLWSEMLGRLSCRRRRRLCSHRAVLLLARIVCYLMACVSDMS